jgi:glyoxylase I family protein
MTGKPPFRPLGLDHLLLVVRDLDQTLSFYRDVVGCEVVSELPQYGMVELDAGVSLVNAASPEGAWALKGHGSNLDHFCVGVGGCDDEALRAHLAAHAAPIEEERLENGRLSLYVRDPSGNAVELMNKSAG